jgi:hypothetical protein
VKLAKPGDENDNVLENKTLSNGCDGVGKPGGKAAESRKSQVDASDARLKVVIEAWEHLPEALRAGITAMVTASLT